MTRIKSLGVASLFAAASLLTFVAPVQATLIGDTITATGFSLGPASATIGAGVEFNAIDNSLFFNFGANTLTITDPFVNGITGIGNFVFAGFDDVITSVSIASNTGFSGSIVNHFVFDAHSLTLDVKSINVSNPHSAILVFNIIQESAAVPEPATFALFGLGLAGFACTRRKQLSGMKCA